jgi:hypothetical protein
MELGQGYNSFIQETRINKAVLIEIHPVKAVAVNDGKSKDGKSIEVVHIDSMKIISKIISEEKLTEKDPLSILVESVTAHKSKDHPDRPYILNPSAAATSNQHVNFSSKQIDKTSDINEALGISASAAIKSGGIGVGGEVGGSLATEKELKESDLNFFLSVRVVNEPGEQEKTMTFEAVPGLREMLLSMRKSSEKATSDSNVQGEKRHDAGNDIDDAAIYFNEIYGDTFISDFVRGGELYALVRIRLHDKAKRKEVQAYAAAQLTPPSAPVTASAKTDFLMDGQQAFHQSETFIRVQWRGGGEIKSHDYPWSLDNLISIANAFPTFVGLTSANIRAVVTPYSSLKSFHEWVHENTISRNSVLEASRLSNLTMDYSLCSIYVETLLADFNAYSEICTTLDDLISNMDFFWTERGNTSSNHEIEEPEDSTAGKLFSFTLKRANPLHSLDASQFSELRYKSRYAMLYIQQEVLEVVKNPRKVRIWTLDSGCSTLMDQPYPCPSEIANSLPKVSFSC